MTNPTMATHDGRTISRGSIELRRQRVIADEVEERVRVTNFNPFPVTLNLLYELGADFSDIFDVRGYERERLDEELVLDREPVRTLNKPSARRLSVVEARPPVEVLEGRRNADEKSNRGHGG